MTDSEKYLDDAISAVRESLPAWQLAVIEEAIISGVVARKAMVAGVRSLTKSEFESLVSAYEGDDGIAGLCAPSLKTRLLRRCVGKGFNSGHADGGSHVHGIDRENSQTFNDGYHAHIYKLPGSGQLLMTDESGYHAHGEDLSGGEHSHEAYIGNEWVKTKLEGEHSHERLAETTTLDGFHTHTLVLADGTEIESLDVEATSEAMESVDYSVFVGANGIANMLNRNREIREYVDRLVLAASISWGVEEYGVDEIVSEILASEDEQEFMSVAMSLGKSDELDQIAKRIDSVPFVGDESARLVFVAASPSPLEKARCEALVGRDGEMLASRYLSPLGLTRKDVAVGFAVPVEGATDNDLQVWRDRLRKSLEAFPGAKVVALGRVAKQSLGSLADFSLPHPVAIRRHFDSGELARKLKAVGKSLDKSNSCTENNASKPIQGEQNPLADLKSETTEVQLHVSKSAKSKQIVYGVILDPYQVDLQNDWLPPSEIESTAHDFLSKSRVIGLNHGGQADAEVVESWIEIYPTEEDRNLAFDNKPHKAYRRKFGGDFVHSGAWLAGVHLSDKLWKQKLAGKLDAFSIGGFSFSTKMSSDEMPVVEFVDLVADEQE